MESTSLNISPDLQVFIRIFDPIKFKLMVKGIEIRGINDLHRNIMEAKDIIAKMKLKLIVSHNAEMLSYRGFEVNNL